MKGQDGQKGNYLEIENWLNINVNIDTFKGFGLFGGTFAILPPFWTEMCDPNDHFTSPCSGWLVSTEGILSIVFEWSFRVTV